MASHASFAAAEGLDFPLIADPSGEICTLLGVLPDPQGSAKRTTFVIDRKGVIRSMFENVVVAGHVDAVYDVLSAL